MRADALPPALGLQAVVSGSCSVATNAQVRDFRGRGLSQWDPKPENYSPSIYAADILQLLGELRAAAETSDPRLPG
mgnify:CR=1 FL=1